MLFCAGCAEVAPPTRPLEFLTRDGCAQTAVMRGHLDEVVAAMRPPLTYRLVDLDTLPVTDVRKAYPTPTILYGGADLFGMAEPRPPFDEPT